MAHETVPADIAAAIDALERLQQVWGRAMEGGSYRAAGTAAREARAALDAAILKHLREAAEMKAAPERIEQGV